MSLEITPEHTDDTICIQNEWIPTILEILYVNANNYPKIVCENLSKELSCGLFKSHHLNHNCFELFTTRQHVKILVEIINSVSFCELYQSMKIIEGCHLNSYNDPCEYINIRVNCIDGLLELIEGYNISNNNPHEINCTFKNLCTDLKYYREFAVSNNLDEFKYIGSHKNIICNLISCLN